MRLVPSMPESWKDFFAPSDSIPEDFDLIETIVKIVTYPITLIGLLLVIIFWIVALIFSVWLIKTIWMAI